MYTPTQMDLFINYPETKQEKLRINGFNIIKIKPGCHSCLKRHVFTSGMELEEKITLKQNNLNLYLKDLNKVQEYEKMSFFVSVYCV